jgi:hypothetical protein
LLLFNRGDFDRGDEGLETVKVFIALWQNADCGEFALAELRGQVFESPTQNHHVRCGKCQHEFLRRCVPVVVGVRVWSDGVVNQLYPSERQRLVSGSLLFVGRLADPPGIDKALRSRQPAVDGLTFEQ